MGKNYTVGEILGILNGAAQKGLEMGRDFSKDKLELRKKIARRMQEVRQANRVTQAEFSELIDCNFMTYKGYENLHSDVPLVYLIRIADLCHVSLDYLTGRTDDMKGMYAADAIPAETDTNLADRIAQLEKAMQELKDKA